MLVKERLGAAANTFWRDDELNRLIQESLRFWNALTGFWKQSARLGTGSPAVTVADQVWYTMNGSLTSNMRVSFNNIPLSPSSWDDLDKGQSNWESDTTASGGDAPTIPTIWCPGGLTSIAIWPADHVGGNTLTADGIAVTPLLTADADFLDIGDEELQHLLDYIEHIAVFKEGGAEFEASMPLLEGCIKGAAARNALLTASSKFRTWAGFDKSRETKKRMVVDKVGAR